jgi:uncharacterized protein YkwD
MGRRGMWFASAIVVAALAMPAAPAGAVSFDTGAERAFVGLVNRERVARGLRPLEVRSDLVALARRHTRAMVAADNLFHNYNVHDEVRPRRYATGENVGYGTSVSDLHAQFMDSPSHRRNVLFSIFTQIGVGVAYDATGWMYVTLDFARPYGPAKPAAQAPVVEPARTVDLLLRLTLLDAA